MVGAGRIALGTVVEHVASSRSGFPPRRTPYLGWWAASILLAVIAVILLSLVLRAKLQGAEIPPWLVVAVAVAFGAVILLGTGFLVRALEEYRASQDHLQQMASNIGEIFWTIDAETKRALYLNDAYETITGRSCQSLLDNPTSYEGLIHPEDRARVLAKLEEATQTGQFDERFRIVCIRGEVRWVKVHGFPVRDRSGKIRRLIGTAQEITAQKEAEDQVAKNLAVAQSAWAEADALRKGTLALTQDLRMDFVLDALLRSLAELVPYTCARVLIPEGGPHWLARRFANELAGGQSAIDPLGTAASAVVQIRLAAGRIVAGVNAEHVPPAGRAADAWRRALYVYCTIAQPAAEAVYFQSDGMVELVGIEPTTSSLRTMRSPS